MASLIGTHNRTNGIKQIPSRAVFALNGSGLGPGEQHPDTLTIVRDTRVFPDGEAPPDFNSYDGSNWPAYGEYWYAVCDTYWNLNPADYYAIQNEQGGNDPWAIQRTIDIERAIMQAANADGRQCCILNLAGGSPGDFELWKAICAPFIAEAWENGGNVYGRHVYADKFVNDDWSIVPGQPQRVIDELEYLRAIGYGGGVILTEFGFNGGYGVVPYEYFEQQVKAYEAALLPYADILIGWCQWELGNSEFNANYTSHMQQLLPYLQQVTLPKWAPPTIPPEGNMALQWKRQVHQERPFPVNPETTHLEVSLVPKLTGEPAGEGIKTLIEIPQGFKGILLISEMKEVEDTNPKPPPVINNPLPQGALVVDLSYANDVDLAILKANGVQGVILRASNGIRTTGSSDTNGVDIRFWSYLEEVTALGMAWGSFHYCNENYGDAEQVEHFCGIIQDTIDNSYPPPSLGLWLDFETPDDPIYAGAPTSENRIQALCTALVDLRPLPVDCGVYSSPGWWNGKVPNALTWMPALGMKQWLASWVPESKLTDGLYPPEGWNPGNLLGFTGRYRWQFTPAGGYTVGHTIKSLDLNYEGGVPPAPPPTGETVDILPYFQPSGTFGRYVVFHFSDGRTQPQQMEKLVDGRTILWKGEGQQIDGKTVYDYEEMQVDAQGVKKHKDTSSGGASAYDLDGVMWLPRVVEIGKVYQSSPTVREFNRVTCQTTASKQTTDYIYVKELLPVWTSPINSAITFNSVLVCEWRKTPDTSTPPIEVYKLAPDVMYCEWNNGAVGELPEGRQPLSFELTNCQ